MPDLKKQKKSIAPHIKILSVLANLSTVGEMMEKTTGQYK